jgi:hypothetical protein
MRGPRRPRSEFEDFAALADDDEAADLLHQPRRGPRPELSGRSGVGSKKDAEPLDVVEEFEIIDEDFDSPDLDLDLPLDRSPHGIEDTDDEEKAPPIHVARAPRRPTFKKPPTKKTPAKKPPQIAAQDKPE